MTQSCPVLPPTESLTVEFKSDLKRLSDDDLVEALTCLANSEGGELWLGVEDDGTPTGLHAAHLRLVVEQEGRQSGKPLPIDSLIALAALREHRRLDAEELARHIQRDAGRARRTLERLMEAGLVQAHGSTRGRSYTLSAEIYRAQGEQVAYTRQLGFSRVQHPEMVLNYVSQHGRIQRAEAMELCRLSGDQAQKLLRRMTEDGRLTMRGNRRGAFYVLAGSGQV